MITTILPWLQATLTLANICVMGYVFIKFINKPHDTLEERVTALEVKQRETEQKLMQGNDKFRSLGKVLEVLVTCTLALLDWEVHYCETEHKEISDDLVEAKKSLNKCLSKINKEGTE